MVNYICLFCKKNFSKKSNYDTHYKSCENNFNKIIDKYKKYNIYDMLKDYTNAITNIVTKNDEKEYICDKCNKKYESYNGLKRHMLSKACSKKKLDACNKIKQKYNISNQSNTAITTTNSNNISNSQINSNNNNITNHINNNIKLVPYDDIKYDYMKEEVLRKAFAVPGEAFESITTDTFFDPDNKENHVIYCPNLKDNDIHVFNGNKFTDGWDILDKKKFFKEMLIKQMRTLEKIFKCNEDDDNPLEIDNIVGFTNLLKEFNANSDVIKEYTKKLNTICYKKNHMVKQTIDESKEETKDNKIRKMIQKALANGV